MKLKSPAYLNAYDATTAVITSIWDHFKWFFYILLAWMLLRILLGVGVDDSDASKWERSGMKILTDHKTGIQYLSDGKGGMVRRETK